MATLCLSSPSLQSFSLYTTAAATTKFSASQQRPAAGGKRSILLGRTSSSLHYNPLRVLIGKNDDGLMARKTNRRGSGAVCYAGSAIHVNSLHWTATVCSAVLLFAKGTAIQKSFVVPLLALQAPAHLISWMKGEYGMWAAFLALLVRLFFFIPASFLKSTNIEHLSAELELPLVALLLVIVAPYQVLDIRGRQEGAIIALVIAGYLAFQHFSRIGSLQKSFDRGSIIATLALVFITVVSCLLLF